MKSNSSDRFLMKHRRTFTALVALGCLLLSQPSWASTEAGGVPVYKVTSPGGKSSILIGGVHSSLPGLRQPDASIFNGIRVYVVEQLAGEGPVAPAREPWLPALMELQKTGRLGRAPWAQGLADAEVAELKRRLQCVGFASDKADEALSGILALASPLTAAEVAIRPCATGGAPSRDEFLLKRAQERGLPTLSLELNSEVEVRRRRVPDDVHLHHLRVGLGAKQGPALAVIAKALNTGEFSRVNRKLGELAGNPQQAAVYERVMVIDRNRAWIPKLLRLFEQGDALVNVGAAHLDGNEGVAALLRTSGMKVELTVLPAERGNAP